MRTILLICTLLVIASLDVTGQDIIGFGINPPSLELEFEDNIIPERPDENVFIQQVGNNNIVDVIQTSIINGSNNNYVLITQGGINGTAGDNNVAVVNQNGNNLAAFISQASTNNRFIGNYADIGLEGDNITSVVNQTGRQNLVLQRVTPNEKGLEQTYVIEQVGQRNLVYHQDNGSFAPKFKVTQRGNGAAVLINTNTPTPIFTTVFNNE